jgi:hypothetical protein
MTESFKKQHEKLRQTENDLKADLRKKVTELKENLENFLTESDEILKGNERINKVIKFYEKSEINSIIKSLSYISEIEKNNTRANDFLLKLMKSMNISFDESNNSLKYNNYLFNGLKPLSDIKLYLENDKIKMSWNNTDDKISDKDKWNYILEVQYNNKVDTFKGKENIIIIENVNRSNNQKYKARIALFYKGAYSEWSKYYDLNECYKNFPFFGFGNNNNEELKVYGLDIKNKNFGLYNYVQWEKII